MTSDGTFFLLLREYCRDALLFDISLFLLMTSDGIFFLLIRKYCRDALLVLEVVGFEFILDNYIKLLMSSRPYSTVRVCVLLTQLKCCIHNRYEQRGVDV
jgi:hypothetical protein